MTVKYITVKGPDRLAREPFYMGIPQHDRTLSRREFYDLVAGRTGYRPTAVKAAFMALAEYIRENQGKGNITYIDGVASIRNYVRGSFEGLAGPWVKGRNVLMVNAVEMDPFKTILAAILPVNKTEGAKPAINTVLDETTLVYDVITGTDEYVAFVNARGLETKAEIEFSDLQNVKAHLATALEPGEYTLKVHTRSGLGDQFGVRVASRKVMVG